MPPWAQPSFASARGRQWPAFALVVAWLVVLGVAIVGWFRPLPHTSQPLPTFSAQQVADAKAKVCDDYQQVHNAVKASSAGDKGPDPISQMIFGINGQQKILTGSLYLRTILVQQPATPSDLASTISRLTDIFQELVVDYQNGMTESEMEPTLRAADNATAAIEGLC
jgi:hypothetical protein